MGNSYSNQVIGRISKVVTRFRDPKIPESSPEEAAKVLVNQVLRQSLKKVLDDGLLNDRPVKTRKVKKVAIADPIEEKAEEIVTGVLEAAVNIIINDLVPSLDEEDHHLSRSSAVENIKKEVTLKPGQPATVNNDVKEHSSAAANHRAVRFNTEAEGLQSSDEKALNSLCSSFINHKRSADFVIPSSVLREITIDSPFPPDNSLFSKSSSEAKLDMQKLQPYVKSLCFAGEMEHSVGHVTVFALRTHHLPESSCQDYDTLMRSLLIFFYFCLRQIKSQNFSILFLHSNAAKSKMPTLAWMKMAVQLLEKTSLRQIFVLHDSFALKTMGILSRTFTSKQFRDKVIRVNSVKQLSAIFRLKSSCIPQEVFNSEG